MRKLATLMNGFVTVRKCLKHYDDDHNDGDDDNDDEF